jgi:hypothetical protein
MSFILDFFDKVNAKVDQVKQQASSSIENARKEFEGLVGVGIAVVVLLVVLLAILIAVQIKNLRDKKNLEKKQNMAYKKETCHVWTTSNETQV